MTIQKNRRQLIKLASLAPLFSAMTAAGLFPSAAQAAWAANAFEAKSLDEALVALGAHASVISPELQLACPDIAENGSLVPVQFSTNLPDVTFAAILVEKNPTILAASFKFAPGTACAIQVRIKMGQTSNVLALVCSRGGFFIVSREVKVTLGGCGG